LTFVANRSGASVTGYPPGASGNAAPTINISGSNTLLVNPIALAVDSAGRVYTANDGSNIVEIFASGATGNVAPAAQVQFTGQTEGVTVDSLGNLWVASFINNTIYEFAAGATGTPAAIKTIVGSNTQLSVPTSEYIDASGKLYVCDHAGGIVVFAAGASGNATPLEFIAGSNTQLVTPFGVVVDSAGRIIVADLGNAGSSNGAVRIYAAGATGNVAPVAVISGPATGLASPSGVTLDASGNIWVGDNAGAIFEFASNASGNVAPIRSIQGNSTLMNAPFGPVLH
jgi:hypothetical protein